ncbi:hypothetical protein ACPA9J_04225 [Pseudomonas aeruginosa]
MHAPGKRFVFGRRRCHRRSLPGADLLVEASPSAPPGRRMEQAAGSGCLPGASLVRLSATVARYSVPLPRFLRRQPALRTRHPASSGVAARRPRRTRPIAWPSSPRPAAPLLATLSPIHRLWTFSR